MKIIFIITTAFSLKILLKYNFVTSLSFFLSLYFFCLQQYNVYHRPYMVMRNAVRERERGTDDISRGYVVQQAKCTE